MKKQNLWVWVGAALLSAAAQGADTRVGIIGLDTSHAIAFAKLLNVEKGDPAFEGFKVTAAYTYGSLDIPTSTNRYPLYTKQMKEMGVEIVGSIADLLKQTDVILLETNDGRRHLEQALEVFKAGKRVFIDKPIAASLTDVLMIFDAAKKYGVPVFSSSALRYTQKTQKARAGEFGRIIGADAVSPCSLEPTHPDLFWYGIHGVEPLFTVMGTGCESAVRVSLENVDVVVGTWKDGRVGTMRGIRGKGAVYGCDIIAEKGGRQAVGGYESYKPLLVEIVKFFKTGEVPVPPEETIEMFAFMEAAHESKRRGGVPVTLAEVLAKARAEAAQKGAR
ncbi:MAG: Gfo/Idh/MocA family oxidoreductase [Kiritimatiellae bacterium]|nr:Gfo/Idh/MocA family oxidoreductase [Kiritimatiellia bacterium]